MNKVVLLAHGETKWSRDHRFVGWTDVDLSPRGERQAMEAGRMLRNLGYSFDCAFVSVLTRAVRTLWLVAEELKLLWLPLHKSWLLNDRHYGAFEGLTQWEVADYFGVAQVQSWLESYTGRPPTLEFCDWRHPRFDARYAETSTDQLPASDSLADSMDRSIAYWQTAIMPRLAMGERLLICAHVNTLRALVSYLDDLPAEEAVSLEIPEAVPLVYEFDDNLRPVIHYCVDGVGVDHRGTNLAQTRWEERVHYGT